MCTLLLVVAGRTDSNVGARKLRNIRDNIFVMNAIFNSMSTENGEALDCQVFDIEKCFDALWLHEVINCLYEAGLRNDKLPLLFLENKNAQVAVKTNNKISSRVNIKDIIMLEIGSMNKAKFKKIVKSHVNQAAFCYLKSLKEGHSKMEKLNYSKFEKASYLNSPMFNTESVQLLLALRTRTVKGMKMTFVECIQTYSAH